MFVDTTTKEEAALILKIALRVAHELQDNSTLHTAMDLAHFHSIIERLDLYAMLEENYTERLLSNISHIHENIDRVSGRWLSPNYPYYTAVNTTKRDKSVVRKLAWIADEVEAIQDMIDEIQDRDGADRQDCFETMDDMSNRLNGLQKVVLCML